MIAPTGTHLLGEQVRLIGAQARCTVFDVGCHQGTVARRYLELFPNATVYGFEPDERNLEIAAGSLGAFSDRLYLVGAAVSDTDGEATLHLNSHVSTHSLFDIGEQKYWAGYAEKVCDIVVPTTTLDSFAGNNGTEVYREPGAWMTAPGRSDQLNRSPGAVVGSRDWC
jgi:FkbM family methyltransferase